MYPTTRSTLHIAVCRRKIGNDLLIDAIDQTRSRSCSALHDLALLLAGSVLCGRQNGRTSGTTSSENPSARARCTKRHTLRVPIHSRQIANLAPSSTGMVWTRKHVTSSRLVADQSSGRHPGSAWARHRHQYSRQGDFEIRFVIVHQGAEPADAGPGGPAHLGRFGQAAQPRFTRGPPETVRVDHLTPRAGWMSCASPGQGSERPPSPRSHGGHALSLCGRRRGRGVQIPAGASMWR